MLNRYYLLLLLVPFSLATAADTMIPSEQVRHLQQYDWNKDGGFDLAVLYRDAVEPDQLNLRLYVSSSENLVSFMTLQNAAWQGMAAGTEAALELNKLGSLVLVSGNDAIGRNRWNQKVTIAWRNNTFVVAGFTYISRDTLDLDNVMNCDVNLLQGRGIKNGKDFKVEQSAPVLSDWTEDWVSEICFDQP